MTLQKKTESWQRTDLEKIPTQTMDAQRLKSMLSNIESSMAADVNNKDNKKLRELKAFFERELRRRGE